MNKAALDRRNSHVSQWQSDKLLLGQCCGPDLFTAPCANLRVIGRPVLRGLDCAPGEYYSHIVTTGELLPGSVRIVANAASSRSGYFALLEWLCENGRQVSDISISGSHNASLQMLRTGQADVAAIDACSFDFLDQSSVTIVDRSRPSLTPPFVQHSAVPLEVDVLAKALVAGIKAVPHGHFAGFISSTKADYMAPQHEHTSWLDARG